MATETGLSLTWPKTSKTGFRDVGCLALADESVRLAKHEFETLMQPSHVKAIFHLKTIYIYVNL